MLLSVASSERAAGATSSRIQCTTTSAKVQRRVAGGVTAIAGLVGKQHRFEPHRVLHAAIALADQRRQGRSNCQLGREPQAAGRRRCGLARLVRLGWLRELRPRSLRRPRSRQWDALRSRGFECHRQQNHRIKYHPQGGSRASGGRTGACPSHAASHLARPYRRYARARSRRVVIILVPVRPEAHTIHVLCNNGDDEVATRKPITRLSSIQARRGFRGAAELPAGARVFAVVIR